MSKKIENTIDFSMILASSVHDMKNSVGMLLASLEGLMDEMPPVNAAQNKRFSTLHYEASRMNGELIQLLSLYRMQNNLLPVHIDEHYLIDILDDQVARNHMLAETKGVEMNIQCDPDLHWYFDHDLIGSVVHNILVNCVRYTQSKIEISAKIEDEILCVSIADNGPGYPPEMLQRPTGKVEDAEISKGATHLGLYFAQKIAECHKQQEKRGYIELTNGACLGGGVFKLYLP
ncbi:signal transduction histidine kinase [Alteromonadaceae bacterium Bs31]|nr:signal transduction histidine kinase [Alteromonadaceae bacterium Bs31]